MMKYYLIAIVELLLLASVFICMGVVCWSIIAKMPRPVMYQFLFGALVSGCVLFLTVYMGEESAYDQLAVWRAKQKIGELAVASAFFLLACALAGIGGYYLSTPTVSTSFYLRYAAGLTAILLAPVSGRIGFVSRML